MGLGASAAVVVAPWRTAAVAVAARGWAAVVASPLPPPPVVVVASPPRLAALAGPKDHGPWSLYNIYVW